MLKALVEECNVKRGQTNGRVSQLVMSNALARLRCTVDGPLLMGTVEGITPTAVAQALVVPVRQAAVWQSSIHVMIARRAGVKTLVLKHILLHIDQPGIRGQIICKAKKNLDGQVIGARKPIRDLTPVSSESASDPNFT